MNHYAEYRDELYSGSKQTTTFGACACEDADVDQCFDVNMECDQRRNAQFATIGGIPRYKHHLNNYQYKYTDSPFENSVLSINKRCQQQRGWWHYAGLDPQADSLCYFIPTTEGWDQSEVPSSDGCESMMFNFENMIPEVPEDMIEMCSDSLAVMTMEGSEVARLNHRSMDWYYLNEPSYWVALEYDINEDGVVDPITELPYDQWYWEGINSFEGRYVKQWAGWSKEEDESTGDIVAWNASAFVDSAYEYKDRSEASYVWYTDRCEPIGSFPPIVDIDPFVHVYDQVAASLSMDQTSLWQVDEIYDLHFDNDGNYVFSSVGVNLGTGEIEAGKPVETVGFETAPAEVPMSSYALGSGIARLAARETRIAQDEALEGNASAIEIISDEGKTFKFMFGGVTASGVPTNALWMEEPGVEGHWKLLEGLGEVAPPGLADSSVSGAGWFAELVEIYQFVDEGDDE